jgi:hypothetical protein
MLPFRSAAVAALAAVALMAPAAAHADANQDAPYDDAGYWALADRMQQRFDRYWDAGDGYYHANGGGADPMANAMMLLTHSVAAMAGHEGPARNDARARRLAARLVETPPFVTSQSGTGQVHAPGFVNSMSNKNSGQHLVFDAEVIDGLTYAYRAREALELPEETVDKLRSAIHETARGSFWRWPTIRLNQINWYATVYAADATVTGDKTLLTHDLPLQLRRFFNGAKTNFGPGMRFHYLPHEQVNHPFNLDSAEYANIVLSFTRFYNQAREAGMGAFTPAHKQLLQQWIERAVAGYWTHSGYMNWDSGLGFGRWHQAKKLGLTQQALIGIAQSPSLLKDDRWGRWAKYMLDRGFNFYERTALRDGGLADALFFGVHKIPQGDSDARLAAARIEANVARAIDAGLGRAKAAEPPALYAYDPDIGRLAVTTPAYNTAIVAVNQHAFPYGGLDLARLFDGNQEVLGNIGGTPPASFGALVRNLNGARVLASQVGRRDVDPRVTPLRLVKAPFGTTARASSAVGHAFAGAFTDLQATGTVSGPTASIKVTHTFTPSAIQTRWDVTRKSTTAAYTVDVLFPSTGKGAKVTAVLRDGSRARVGDRRIALDRVKRIEVASEHATYSVMPLSKPKGAALHLLRPAAQDSQPHPGPTLAVQLERGARFSHTALSVRIRPLG